MAAKFGNTWWGAEWLKSLDYIDYDNRLPRGAKYARDGYVTKLTIKGNVIKAKVQGTRRKPYDVGLVIPPFSDEEKERFIDALTKRPVVISRLLNNDLSPEVLDIAQSCGLRIFPQKWSDIKMGCDCPDWAVPCKHIAAVIYLVSREIDNNPFIVFSMHNTDIIEELGKRGIGIDNALDKIDIPNINSLVRTTKKGGKHTPVAPFGRVDFNSIVDLLKPLLLLLPQAPTFYPNGDFKNLYSSQISSISKTVVRYFIKKSDYCKLFLSCQSDIIPSITVDTQLQFHLNDFMEWSVSVDSENQYLSDKALVLALLNINPDFLSDYHPTVIAAHQTLVLALHLVANGNIIPEIIYLANQQYAIRWQAISVDNNVKTIIDDIQQFTPHNLVVYSQKKRQSVLPVENSSQWLLSLFIGLIMQNNTYADGNRFINLFFRGITDDFSDVGSTQTPQAIKAWINHCQVSGSKYRPIITVDEGDENKFYVGISAEERDCPQKAPHSMYSVLNAEQFAGERLDIIRGFSLLSSIIPEIEHYFASGAFCPMMFDSNKFVHFLLDVIPAVKLLGIKVFLPKALQELLRPKATMKIKRNSEASAAGISIIDLLQFDWQVALGDNTVDIETFMQLIKDAEGLIRFKQQYIYLAADELKKLTETFTAKSQPSSIDILQAALSGEYEGAKVSIDNEVLQLIKELTDSKPVSVPDGLNATLRPYQERGYSWMYKNLKIGFGSILADDMGLGKTLQTIALILKLKNDGLLNGRHALIVVPTGLITNWQAELDRFAPTLSHFTYHGTGRSLKHFDSDIMLTSYGVARADNAKLKKMDWCLMIIDEAQNIKNPQTAQSKAIHGIPAQAHIALSGTPVENRLTEYWNIMEFANHGYLNTLKHFKDKFANPIQISNDSKCIERFRRITAPFMMRRTKSDKNIISDLPDKIEYNDYATLTPEQTALYNSTLDEAMGTIEKMDTSDSKSLFKRQGLILQMILALKQICNHPAQFLKNGDLRPELSGKVATLLDMVESIVDSGEKVLIFTQFTQMAEMLTTFIGQRIGRAPLYYHGGCSIKERQAMVERFQENKNDKVFVLSLKAAGTGLNLTAASHVVHFDLWWNPAVEAQATDRAYRIGQKSNVVVHRFITANTFEERIDKMIQSKKHLAEMTVATGENWIGHLSNSELKELFKQ